MREVKEKSPLKARAVETLKSAPQAAFRRGTDASFQQLRQELREAAQDGQPEDRYESGKITDTADHAVQEVRHLAEKAAHRLPKTKSESEARTKSVPQHKRPQPQHSTTEPREYPPQSQSQGNQSVRESASPIREKSVSPVNVQQPKKQVEAVKTDARQPKERNNCNLTQLSATKSTLAEQRPFGHAPVVKRPAAPATTPTVQPSARTLPREKTPVSSLHEQPVTPKTDTTQFALPEIKTKEYIRKKRKKQHLLNEEASGIEDMLTDSETFSPVIRTRETVREQQKLHVSHSAEQAQPALPQIRTRQPQTASMSADIEPTKPEVPQPPLPDIKSKQKYIAAQQPTQATPVQANLQQAARQTGMKAARGEPKLCKSPLANETVAMPANRNVAPAKPVRVQKQVRPAVVRKQKIKTAPKAKIKSATPAAKALPSKASTAPPKQAAAVIRKGQVLRDTAIKAAKTAKEAGKKVLRAIVAAAEKLAAAIGAGGAAAVSVVVVILLVGMLFASPLGILFAGEDTGTEIKIPDAVATLNGEFTDEIYRIMEDHPYDELDMQEGMEAAMLQNWRNVLAVYAVKVSTDEEHGLDVMTMDEEKLQLLREVFFDANQLVYELTTRIVDGERVTTLHISAQIKDAMRMADEYSFTDQQREMLEELLKSDYDDIFRSLIGNYQPDGTPIGPVNISDIQGTLPDDLDPLRESIVLTAYQLLGKVTYFWGGKSLVLGWDSRWGTPTTVTASGSGSTGKVLPFGLDCSGFVDWTFYNATNGAYLPGRGGGAASQHGYCTSIAWSDALPGDLVFYADDSHVGIVCGYDSVGNLLVIHCSGGQNGVVVTGREGFAVAARPDLFTD